MNPEVLVHIKAPSRVADDRRYISIAEQVLAFDPINTIEVTQHDVTSPLHESSSSWTWHSVSNEEAPNLSDLADASLTSAVKTVPRSPSRSRCDIRLSGRVTKVGQLSRVRQFPEKIINPPYKSPLKKQKQFTDVRNVAEIQIPCTDMRKKRARLESNRSSSEDFVIANSQPTTTFEPSGDLDNMSCNISMKAVLDQSVPNDEDWNTLAPEESPANVLCPGQSKKQPNPSAHSFEDDLTRGRSLFQDRSPNALLLTNWDKISNLPLVLYGPGLPVGQTVDPQHIHPVLKATAEALNIDHSICSRNAARFVHNHERGYWQVTLRITLDDRITTTFPCTRRQQLSQISQTWRPLLKKESLTGEEFLEIWHDLDALVSSGRAGPCVRIMRRHLSVTGNHIQHKLHLFCYGSEIPYVYAMLLVCTRMYVSCQPVHWISAVDESVVITMPGCDLKIKA